MIMLKHNLHNQITFSICSSGVYNSHITGKQTSNVKDLRVKSRAKTHTDLHNGDIKITVFSFSVCACYHQVSSMMAIKKRP